MAELFAVLSGIIVLIGAPFYLFDILKGKTKPQRTTWFIWSVQGIVAVVSQAQLGAHWSLWFAGLSAAGNISVLLLSLKYGVGGWQKLDAAALVIAVVGVVISVIAKAPLIALIGVVIADLAGTVPTLKKVYRLPDTETSITWFALGTSALLAIGSVGTFRWSLLIYPLYYALANYSVLVSQLLGRRRAKAAA